MCLAVPGKLVEIYTKDFLRMGKVDYGGITKEVCLEWLPDAAIGEYVLVHVGFALNVIDAGEAAETLRLLESIQPADIPTIPPPGTKEEQ